MKAFQFVRHNFARSMACLSVAGLSLSAQAGVLSGPISVTLTSPGGVTTDGGATVNPAAVLLSDTVTVANGIHANDGPGGFVDTNIGGFMLPGEFITFGGAGADITLRVAAGSQVDQGTTTALDDILSSGYLSAGANRARYVFAGLGITDEVITGFSVTGSGFTAPINLSSLIEFDANAPGTLSVYLDTMLFTPDIRGALFAGGNLTIDLLTRVCTANDPGCSITPPNPNPTPEPASLALVAVALAGALGARRRGRAGAK